MGNQIKWLKSYDTFQSQEHGLDLRVRAEPRNPVQLWKGHRNLIKTPSVYETLGPMHEALIREGLEYFISIQDLAINAAKFRY